MKRTFVGFVILGLTAASMAGAFDADPSQDETEIRNAQARQAETWNRHDAKGYASLFTEDADVVNVLGWWWRGRLEIESKLGAAFAFVFRDSALTISEVHVKFLRPRLPSRTSAGRWLERRRRRGCQNRDRAFKRKSCGNGPASG